MNTSISKCKSVHQIEIIMGSEEELTLKKTKKEKKSKKEKKRKREDEDKDAKKEERKKLKAQKKAEKEEILSKVPKVDEHGIAYTKIQIKRMVKRVQRGLEAVETEAEKRERLRERKREEMETKDELAGMIYQKETKEDEDVDEDEDPDNDDAGDQEEPSDDNDQESDADKEEVGDDEEVGKGEVSAEQCIPAQRKKPRSKPVPDDYVCYACKNKHTPRHWIYDCPDKLHQPGYREVKKSKRGINDPSSRKVFITGIPFDAKTNDVKAYFEKEMKCGKVVNCKLFLFSDTKRCKGNGILTFQSDEGAQRALKLDGTEFNLDTGDDKKKSKKSKNSLWLGVKKMRNRAQTKRN